MGYNTRYKLRADYAPHNKPDEVVRGFVSINENASYCLNSLGDSEEAGKWYDHETDLLSLSRAHPDLLFTLEGEGEQSGDLWKKYFHAGKMQIERATITIAAFSPEKLI